MDDSLLRDAILNRLKEPVVFKNCIEHWPASKWDFSNIGRVFGEHLLKIRIGKNSPNEINLETECYYRNSTVSEFCKWLEGNCADDNPLKDLNCHKCWCYADYKHMCEIFEDRSEIYQSVDWSNFGFEGRNGKESTIWIGSKGASTVCHFDSYGCNLVAQICGRKRWILFPPGQSDSMYQSRLPFEESSNFSQVNIANPDFTKFPLFKKTTPYIVTLEPGDVLFVPHHWWHHVQSLEHSISINTWLELEADHLERLREAVVRNVVFKMMEHQHESTWLNPTEDFTSHSENLSMLNLAAKVYIQNKIKRTSDDIVAVGSKECSNSGSAKSVKQRKKELDDDWNKDLNDDHPSKKFKPNLKAGDPDAMRSDDVIVSPEFDGKHVVRIHPSSVEDLLEALNSQMGSNGDEALCEGSSTCSSSSQTFENSKPSKSRKFNFSDLTIEKLTNAILQQNVIELITENLLKSHSN